MSKEYEYLKKFDSDINRYRKDADMIKKLEKVKKLQFEYDDFEVFDTLISNGKYFPNLETLYIDHYNNDYLSEFKVLLEKDNSVTIHQRNIQALTLEVYKTLNDLNPGFMKEIFYLKQHEYPTRNQQIVYPTPRTVSYGLETFGYKASQLWSNIPNEIQQAPDI